MLAIEAKRNVSSATQSTFHSSTSKRSWMRRSSPGGIELGIFPCSTIEKSLPGINSRSLLHAERSAVDAVVAVARPALYLQPCLAHEQPEVNGVRAGREVGL